MIKRKTTFRPTVQTLETRRCLAGALGIEVAAPSEETGIEVGNYQLEVRRGTDTAASGFEIHGFINTDDPTGDGFHDIITAAGPGGGPNDGLIIVGADAGGGPHVRVFSGADGSELPAAGDSTDTATGVHDFSFQVGDTIFVDKGPPPADAFFTGLERDAVEIIQADVRISNSEFEDNARS